MKRGVGVPLLGAGVLIVVLGGGVLGQAPAGPDAAALFTEVRRQVEEVLGYPVPGQPQVVAATAEARQRWPDAELAAQLRCQFATARREEMSQAFELADDALLSAAGAAHRPGQEVILTRFDDALRRRIESQAPPGAQPADFWKDYIRLVLAHETARLALDQHYGLARRWDAATDAEELRALSAVVEGRALTVTRAVARRLKCETCLPLVVNRFRAVAEPAANPEVRCMVAEAARQHRWAAERGLIFFDYLERQAGRGAEAQVFARPPRQTAWIEWPELYLRAGPAQGTDLADVMNRLQGALSRSEWVPAQQTWTPAMIRQAAGLLGEKDRAERSLAGWEDGRSLVWTAAADPGKQVGVGVVRFRDEASARAYLGLAVDLARKQDQLLAAPCAGGQRVLESHSGTVRWPGTDEGARSDRKMQLPGAAGPIPISQVWVRHGNLVAEFTWNGLPPDDAWAERVWQVLAGGPR